MLFCLGGEQSDRNRLALVDERRKGAHDLAETRRLDHPGKLVDRPRRESGGFELMARLFEQLARLLVQVALQEVEIVVLGD